MGSSSSKEENNNALSLCRERRRYIKQAIDSRYSLAAAHVSYISSLMSIGLALRRFAEGERFAESLSTAVPSELDNDKTPSHSSYPSPSPSHLAEISDSPLQNGSPISGPRVVSLSYLRAGYDGGGNKVTVEVNSNHGNVTSFVVEDKIPTPRTPPPSWPARKLKSGSSWDFFDPEDSLESFSFAGLEADETELSENEKGSPQFESKQKVCDASVPGGQERRGESLEAGKDSGTENPDYENASPLKGLQAKREDSSEFITHRAKDFLSSVKDIEHRFFRASESGKEISRMLEANNVRTLSSEAAVGTSSSSPVVSALKYVCCRGRTSIVSHEPMDNIAKVIAWKRSASYRSYSSRNPETKEDHISDSGSDFVEDGGMISGSHASTLDRLYAWERKLLDEVKASESIRKEYDQKCAQLRNQFAKDVKAQAIDKTRVIVKDLHSRIRVAIHSVDMISKRIEKIRDEELYLQLMELIQGLIRMWKIMLECHHAQYITISLAYHTKITAGNLNGDSCRVRPSQLQQEMEHFGHSLTNWVNCHASYVESISGWLQNCILLPQEHQKRRMQSCILAPPIFVLCKEWLAGIKGLPTEELSNAIKAFLADLQPLLDEESMRMRMMEVNPQEESVNEDAKNVSTNLCFVQSSLTKVLHRLHKFSESSLKVYEEIRQRSEEARVAYSNGKPSKW